MTYQELVDSTYEYIHINNQVNNISMIFKKLDVSKDDLDGYTFVGISVLENIECVKYERTIPW